MGLPFKLNSHLKSYYVFLAVEKEELLFIKICGTRRLASSFC
uniref:Uncharacterized protein n=1 Tax=Anguilla anguilla TaxID=7936 RepID=A0A0E9XCR4_ANGAN